MDAATPVTESAPSTSADIAANVISEAESSTPDSSQSYGDTAIDTTNAVAAEPAKPVELSPAEKFLLEQGHKARKDDGREPWLRYSTVKGMLERFVNQHKTGWDGERGTLEQQLNEARGFLEQVRSGVSGDPKAFLSELAGIDRRYQAFLEPHQAPPPPQVEMPQPDVPLPDGGRTYSVEGIQKLIEWAVDAKMLPKVDERLKPLTEREAAVKQQAEIEAANQRAHATAQETLKDAQTWPFFGKFAEDGSLTEFQQAVFDELKKDTGKKLTLHAAYIKVASARFAEDDAAKRARFASEVNAAPKSPTLGRQATEPKPSGPRSTPDIVRSVIAKLESGA